MYEETEIPLKQIQLTKGGRMMKPKAIIYGERPHRELSIHEVPLWSFNDKDNVHEIENQKQMAEEIVTTRGSLNNHLIYLQGDYPGIINDASKIEPAAKVSHISYNEETKTFIADISSTYQPFIDMIDATQYFPRVHPCYEAETNHQSSGESTRISSTFRRLLCWLVEPIKNMTKISIEYSPERTDEDALIISDYAAERMKNNAADTVIVKDDPETFLLNKYDDDNEKANHWEIMRTAINTTLNTYCDKIISSSIVGGSYERLGSLRRITLGEKTIDVILQFDTNYDSWVIFIGDATKPRILIGTNGDITADISSFIPEPLCFKDIQTLCDMLATCRNKNWQVKEDTREERMKSCEESEKDSAPEAFSQSLIKDGKRPSKIDYYLAMAEVASTRGTCLRRRFGSVIVKDDRIVSTGYAGAPSGRQNCCDIGYCRREKLNAQRGTMYHLCRSVHSEQNAIINASKEEMLGATLYLAGVNIADGSIVKNADCCSMCKRFIINSGISRVIIKDPEKPEGYRAIDVSEWVSNDDSLDVEVGY